MDCSSDISVSRNAVKWTLPTKSSAVFSDETGEVKVVKLVWGDNGAGSRRAMDDMDRGRIKRGKGWSATISGKSVLAVLPCPFV